MRCSTSHAAVGGVASASELIRGGARWEDLYRLRDEGALIELSRGIYRVADAPATAHLDLVAVCRRAPEGMICLNSAASFWDLTDEMPDSVHVAVARGRHRPRHRLSPDARARLRGGHVRARARRAGRSNRPRPSPSAPRSGRSLTSCDFARVWGGIWRSRRFGDICKAVMPSRASCWRWRVSCGLAR